jgi:hypothetical protein
MQAQVLETFFEIGGNRLTRYQAELARWREQGNSSNGKNIKSHPDIIGSLCSNQSD